MSHAGRVRIEVSDPYPCWTRLYIDNNVVASFHHNELVDLRYAVEKAIQEAMARLLKTPTNTTLAEAKVEMRLP